MRKRMFHSCGLLLFMWVLAGCNADQREGFLFKGEGDNWQTEIYTGQTTESPEKGKDPYMHVKFKGSHPEEVKELMYEAEAEEGAFSAGDIVLDEQGEESLSAEGIKQIGASAAEQLTVTISWVEQGKEQQEVIVLEKQAAPN